MDLLEIHCLLFSLVLEANPLVEQESLYIPKKDTPMNNILGNVSQCLVEIHTFTVVAPSSESNPSSDDKEGA